jgi:hypothetical protein
MKKFRVFSVVVLLAIVFGFLGTVSAGTLEEIAQRGELRIACQTQGRLLVSWIKMASEPAVP